MSASQEGHCSLELIIIIIIIKKYVPIRY